LNLNSEIKKISTDIVALKPVIELSAKQVNGMKDDIKHAKWFIGIAGALGLAISIFATVVLRGIDNRNLFNNQIQKIERLEKSLELIEGRLK